MPDEPLLSSRFNMLTHAQQRAYERHGLDLKSKREFPFR